MTDILTATKDSNKSVITSFKQETHGAHKHVKSTLLKILNHSYPDYHVTSVEQFRVSLLDYAAAGNAESTLDSDDESFEATRRWNPVGDGLEKKNHPGALSDDYQFARFNYQWNSKTFLVYSVTWKDVLDSRSFSMFFVLHPRMDSNIVDGHCIDTDELILAAGKWTTQLHKEIFVFDDGSWGKSKELWKSVNGASWDDVILDPEMKNGLIEDVQGFFDNQSVYAQFAVPWKRGIILHGVPGNGKTVSIKALMSSLYSRTDNIPSLYVKSFENKCNTEQYAIRQIFLQARRSAPCLLIFEDLDSLVNDDVRSYFLNEVDGLESNDGILMIGSTNHLDKLDPAISKRPSRFDRKYHFKLPGDEERRLYAEYWREKLSKNSSVDYPEELSGVIARLTEGFSFAYLKELFVMALLSLVRGFKGDDFEIVDAGEADSAPEEEENETEKTSQATSATEPIAAASSTDQKENDVCTCANICSTCQKPLPSASKKANEAAEKKEEVKKNKMAMPSVQVPEHLADNYLLKVVKHQIRVLHKDMDNTETKDWASGKKGIDGGPVSGGRRALMRITRMNAG